MAEEIVLLQPLKSGEILRPVDAFPSGVSDGDGVGTTADGVKYVRTKRGLHNCQELQIFANGLDMTATINAAYAKSKVKTIEFHVDGGADILVSGTVTIPAGKVMKFRQGTKLTGTHTINGGILDAPNSAWCLSTTSVYAFDQVADNIVSALWWGVSAGNANNVTQFQKAADFAYSKGLSLYIKAGAGAYRTAEFVVRCNTFGDPGFKTILTGLAGSTGGYVLALGYHQNASDWEFNQLTNLKIEGESGAHNGIRFWNLGENYSQPYSQYDALAGRWRLAHILFNNQRQYAIRKQFGGIGNYYDCCTFEGGYVTEFFYHAVSQNIAEYPMHTGNDTFNHCHFRGSLKSVMYIDCQVEGGMFKVQNCIMESNLGLLLYVKNGGNTGNTLGNPYTIENCHFEANSFAGSIPLIDGVSLGYEYNFYINNCSPVIFREIAHGRVSVVDSNLFLENCNHYVNSSFISKTRSTVKTKNPFGFYYSDTNSISEGVVTYKSFAKVRRPFPTSIINGHTNLLKSESFETGKYAFVNGFSASRVADNVLGSYCLEVNLTATPDDFLSNTHFAIPANKYIVIGLGVKRTGTAVTILFSGDSTFEAVTVDGDSAWHYTYCMRKSTTAISNLYIYFQGQTGTVRLSHFQALAFDTQEDADLFLLQETFAEMPRPREFWDTASPVGTSHQTYNVGDICWNSDPGAGEPTGWRCTVAGTPGTWEAIISAAPAGSNTWVQWNNAGAFGASNNLTFNDSAGVLTVTSDVGTDGGAALTLLNNAGVSAALGVYSSTHVAYGVLVAGSAYLYTITAAGFTIMVDHATAPILFAGLGGAELARLTQGSQFILPGKNTDSSLRIGSFEVQGYAVNNVFITDNLYHNGSVIKYRANGYGSLIQLSAGDFIIYTAPSGTAAATATTTARFTVSNTGTVIISGLAGSDSRVQLATSSGELITLANGANGTILGVVSGGPAFSDATSLGLARLAGSLQTITAQTQINSLIAGQIKGTGSAPTIAAGTGAGTSPTLAVNYGHDLGFNITITTGSVPAAAGATVATITLSQATGGATPIVHLTPKNAVAVGLFYAESTSTTVITIKAAITLTALTSYLLDITVIDY